MRFITKITIFFFLFTSGPFLLEANANSHVIKEILVSGNNRIEDSTIINYSGLRSGDIYDSSSIDRSLKDLYKTDLFSDIQIAYEDSNIVINVVEHYTINLVAFEGNSALSDEDLANVAKFSSRSTFSKIKLEDDIDSIIAAYRSAGRFSVVVEPKIIKLDFNRINLVFEIKEGPVTKITDINFIGNENYTDRALRTVIQSKRSNWIDAIWGTGKSYDNDLMEYDKELLRQYYRNNGYVNFKITNSIAELDSNTGNFIITFTLDEGKRYKFGDVTLSNSVKGVMPEEILYNISTLEGGIYSASEIDQTSINIVDFMRSQGYPFVVAMGVEKINEKSLLVNVDYQIINGPPVYIERIDISGNQRTFDYVIRRELTISEGDALNQTYLNRSMRNLRRLNFFSDVNVRTLNGSSPDRKIIDITVSESNTGSLSFGAGYSSNRGLVGTVYLTERNLLGKGQYISLNTNLSGDRNRLNLNFTEPSFLDSDVSFGFDIFGDERDSTDTSNYTQSEVGAGVRFGFPLSKDLFLKTRAKYTKNEVYGVPSDASTALKQLEGKRDIAEIGYSLSFSNLDNPIMPTNGMSFVFSQDFSGGDVSYLSTEFSGDYIHDFNKDLIGSLSMEAGHIFALNSDKDVLISQAFMEPGSMLRGFGPRGISPRLHPDYTNSKKEAVGGNTYLKSSAEINFPIPGLSDEYGVRGGLHLNAASLYGSDLVTDPVVNDSSMLRSSAGASIFWDSPIGLLRFDFTEALTKESFDETEFFHFSGGTNF
ncbi:MAG: outer membrane protein assembly factor BamA [Hyphomicrobiales bacterium]|nr:outer membrane protein assembly factor BamA [Hyphomicrobiales bacterium]